MPTEAPFPVANYLGSPDVGTQCLLRDCPLCELIYRRKG